MSSRALSKEDIKKLLASNNTKPAPWPNENDLKRLATAVEQEEPTVQFSDGTVFGINYANAERWGAVFIKPTNTGTYVPCGYISLSKLREINKR